jgi:hypothetical protein
MFARGYLKIILKRLKLKNYPNPCSHASTVDSVTGKKTLDEYSNRKA